MQALSDAAPRFDPGPSASYHALMRHVFDLALVVVGASVAIWGVSESAAPKRRGGRPLEILGSLASPIGIVILLCGATDLLVPGFLP